MWKRVKGFVDNPYTKLSTVSVDNRIKTQSLMMLRLMQHAWNDFISAEVIANQNILWQH